MKHTTIELFGLQNQLTGQLARSTANSSPMFYRTAGLATSAMAARGWTFKQAQEYEVVPVKITVGPEPKKVLELSPLQQKLALMRAIAIGEDVTEPGDVSKVYSFSEAELQMLFRDVAGIVTDPEVANSEPTK